MNNIEPATPEGDAVVPKELSRIPIADIEIAGEGRSLQEEKVGDLVISIQRLGMLSPIGVRRVDGRLRLVYGRHRLAAALALGWSEIDCHVLDADDRGARMAEIAENLHRAELTTLERADQINEWIELSEEGAADKPAQVARVSPAPGGRGKKGGRSQAAREIGIDRDDARRAQTIAALPEEAKAEAKALRLDDNQSALLTAAKSRNPVASLQQHASRSRRSPENGARRQTKERAAEEQKSPLRQLFGAWLLVTPDAKAEFIRSVWKTDPANASWKEWVVDNVRSIRQPVVEPEITAETLTEADVVRLFPAIGACSFASAPPPSC